MASRREQIVSRMVTALEALATAETVTGVHRSRKKAFERRSSPAILVEPVTDVPSQSTLPKIDWACTVRVYVIVHAEVPDQEADPIIAALHEIIMTDATLEGLVVDRLPGPVNFVIEDGDKPIGIIACDYRMQYQSSLTDLEILIS